MSPTRTFISTLLCIYLSACAGGGSSGSASNSDAAPTNETNTAPDTQQPASRTDVIDNEDTSPGLKGIDSNGNGIRDDIDRLIAVRYSQPPKLKAAAEQLAIALQKSMESTTRTQSLFAGDEILRAGACAASILSEPTTANELRLQNLLKDISALTANTKERFTAYWAAEELGSGTTYQQPSGSVCN